MLAGYWNKYSVELDRTSKTLNDADIDTRTIDINNIGSATITFEGNSNSGALVLSPASIVIGESYSFAYLDKPYPNISIDCTGSVCEISVTY